MKPRAQTAAAGWLALWLAGAAPLLAAAGAEPSRDDQGAGLRIAISESIAGEVNGNDLRVAIKAWAAAVEQQTGVRIVPEMCNSAQVIQRIRNRQVDGFSVNILEFNRVAAFAARELVVDESEMPDGQQYVLLVHQSSGIQSLADLRGRSLISYQNTRACLSRVWLDVLLTSAHLGAADVCMGRLESSPKLSRVVLPVFFRQIDACLVTRRGYATMCELNPQLGKQLRPLATSPGLVTTFMGFHKDSPPETRRRFLMAVTELHKTVAGRQALMLFGSTRLVQGDISVLRTSFELLHAYEGLNLQAAGE